MPATARFSFRNPSSRFPLVIAMFTADRLAHALRLRESLQRLQLSHALCEIDRIHSTTSVRGSPDSRFAKPSFIQEWIAHTGKPVLYVDADTVFRALPSLIFQAHRRGSQFAIFNWLSGEDNQTWLPVASAPHTPGFVKGFAVTHSSTEQIIVSGAVQFWGAGVHARALLHLWHNTVRANPRSRDDHALDYAFNNFADRKDLHFAALPRAYCRYAWWPHVTPVIDHPEIPAVNMPWEPLAPAFLARRIHQHLLQPLERSTAQPLASGI